MLGVHVGGRSHRQAAALAPRDGCLQDIAAFPDGPYVPIAAARIAAEDAAQLGDCAGQALVPAIAIDPDVIDDGFARDGPAGMFHQEAQHVHDQRLDAVAFFAKRDHAACPIDLESPDAAAGHRTTFARNARCHLQARRTRYDRHETIAATDLIPRGGVCTPNDTHVHSSGHSDGRRGSQYADRPLTPRRDQSRKSSLRRSCSEMTVRYFARSPDSASSCWADRCMNS